MVDMEGLPDELLCTIFKYTIEDVHRLLILQLVCKNFQRLTDNGYLWYYAYKKMYPAWSFGIQYANVIDWKQFMLKHYKQRAFICNSQLDIVLNSPKIQDPFISEIDPLTNQGIVAIASHHSILFYQYPSYQLTRKLDLLLEDDLYIRCQIVGLQTVDKVTLFAVALHQPLEDVLEDEIFVWKNIIIYKMYSDGTTQCLGNRELSDIFVGRGCSFFQSFHNTDMQQWLHMLSSPHSHNNDSAYLLLYGVNAPSYAGTAQIIQFNITNNEPHLDPSLVPFIFSRENDKFTPSAASTKANVISEVYLGARVSCMIQLKHPLNHLIITGNFHTEKLTIYDIRFALHVGTFLQPLSDLRVQPWGFELVWALKQQQIGLRLIVVGDCQDRFQIKVWDISSLYNVQWDPFSNNRDIQVVEDDDGIVEDQASVYLENWWQNKTLELTRTAYHGYLGHYDQLPFTVSEEAMKKVHLLDAPVKYTAYINLNTWLYLLHENGQLSVMDIESGQFLNTLDIQRNAKDVNVVGEREIMITTKDSLIKSVLP